MKQGVFFLFITLFFFDNSVQSQASGFKETSIGNQVWMVDNLNIDTFQNGDPIPEVKSNDEWSNAGKIGKPAWCYYDNDSINGSKFGKIYNWYAVNDPRGLAPKGWHVPSDGEWDELINYLGGEHNAGKKMKAPLQTNEKSTRAEESVFNGQLGGGRRNLSKFVGLGTYGYFWSTTEHLNNYVWCRYLYFANNSVRKSFYFKDKGLSVRCVKD